MKTAKEALASHLGMDIADLSEYNYQAGRFTRSVYALENGYYCAVKKQSDLPKPTRKDITPFQWQEVSDSYVNKYGWLIFKAV